MQLNFRLPHGRMAIFACSFLTFMTSAQYIQASSADAWEEFQQNVEKACVNASKGALEVKSIQVDPYGSESYGFAIIVGVETGTSTERLFACAYNKTSETAEISAAFDK